MYPLKAVGNEVYAEVIRAVTGQLFTEKQIQQITSHAVGRYLADFFPEPERDRAARERVEEARAHIVEASAIISGMQSDLEAQTEQLDALLADIEEKKKLADKYRKLAETNQENFEALREEMGLVLRQELTSQSEQGKTLRRFASLILWVATLFIGAALGSYFREIVAWIQATEVSAFHYATSRITAEIKGFLLGLSGSWQSIPKPSRAR